MSEDIPLKRNQRRLLIVVAVLLLLYSAWMHWGKERPRPSAPQPVERMPVPGFQGGVAQPPPGVPAGGGADGK